MIGCLLKVSKVGALTMDSGSWFRRWTGSWFQRRIPERRSTGKHRSCSNVPGSGWSDFLYFGQLDVDVERLRCRWDRELSYTLWPVLSVCVFVAGLTITKTCLFKYTENFTTKKWKFSDKIFWFFFIYLLKTIYCGYSLEPPRRVPTIYGFEQK